MVHGNPEGEYWVEIIERSGDEGLEPINRLLILATVIAGLIPVGPLGKKAGREPASAEPASQLCGVTV